MFDTLSSALFIELDVTYPNIKGIPYPMNIVTFNYFLLSFQTVARVPMSRITAPAYRKSIEKVLDLTTNLNPDFERGKNVVAWPVDYSMAQHDGLVANLGENGLLRGCHVHFQRTVTKIANKVNTDEHSKKVFKKIAWKIP